MKVSQVKSFARLVNRNLMAICKNKAALLLPIIPLIITIIVHIALIDGYLIDYLKSVIPSTLMVSDAKCRTFINNWFSSSFVAIVTITYSMVGGVQVVEDKQYGAIKGILSLPIRRGSVSGSYVLSSVIFGIAIGMVALATSMAFLALSGKFYVSIAEVALSGATLILMSIAASIFSNILASFIKTTGIFNALIAVFSVFFAFSIGALVPLASLPTGISQLLSFLTFYETTSLLRNMTFMSNMINLMGYSSSEVYGTILHAFDGEVIIDGMRMSNGSIIVVMLINIIILLGVFIIEKSISIIYRSRWGKS